MAKTSVEEQDTTCYGKARTRGQKTFTVVEQDVTAVKTIAHWIYLNIETVSPVKLRQALESCIVMRDFPKKKIPD